LKYGKCNANLRIHANATNKKLIRMTVICRDGIQTMSRIGKKPINIPTNVEITISGSSVRVKGPKGELIREMPNSIEITKEGNVLTIKPKSGQVDVAKFWGLTRALMMNMIQGVSTGFEKVLEFNGIGFKAAVKGTNLEMSLGFSHPVVFNAPPGIEFKTEKSKVTIRLPPRFVPSDRQSPTKAVVFSIKVKPLLEKLARKPRRQCSVMRISEFAPMLQII